MTSSEHTPASKSSTASLSGHDIWQTLLEGNRRFVQGQATRPRQDAERRAATISAQQPCAVVLGCADSRTSPEIIFDQGLGDLFVVRTAGNVADGRATIGSIEYAVAVLDVQLLVVLGHQNCGAVQASIDAVTQGTTYPGVIGSMIEPVLPAVYRTQEVPEADRLHQSIRANVENQVNALYTTGKVLPGLYQAGRLTIVGAYYSLESGLVETIGD